MTTLVVSVFYLLSNQNKKQTKSRYGAEKHSVNSDIPNTSASCPHLFCSFSLSFFPLFISPYKLRILLNFKMIDFFVLKIATLEIAVQFVPWGDVNEACEHAEGNCAEG